MGRTTDASAGVVRQALIYLGSAEADVGRGPIESVYLVKFRQVGEVGIAGGQSLPITAQSRFVAEALPGKPVDLSADSFDRFIAKAGLPVLVDFWADWCGPCKMMAPVFQQVAGELASRVRFAKVDTEAWPQVSMRHHIKGIPSLILFRNGSEVARISGAMDARNLKAWLASQGVH